MKLPSLKTAELELLKSAKTFTTALSNSDIFFSALVNSVLKSQELLMSYGFKIKIGWGKNAN